VNHVKLLRPVLFVVDVLALVEDEVSHLQLANARHFAASQRVPQVRLVPRPDSEAELILEVQKHSPHQTAAVEI